MAADRRPRTAFRLVRVLALALVGFELAAPSSSSSSVAAASGHGHGWVSAADKVRRLKEQSAKSFVLELGDGRFREYVRPPLRDYSFVVLFAAMASHRMCAICGAVRHEFELTAKAFRLGPGLQQRPSGGGAAQAGGEQLFFGWVDFDGNEEAFRATNVSSVPLLVYFPARRDGRLRSDAMDMRRHGYTAEAMAKWLLERTGLEIRVVRPPVLFGTAGLLVLFFVGSVVIYFRCENLSLLGNRAVWGVAAVGFCLLMSSGQVWNHIRCPPFLTRAANGDLGYVHPSSHSQFIGETYAIFLLNAAITVAVIVLIDSATATATAKNNILPIVCTALAALFFNALLALFRTKASNYPYRGLF